MPRDDPAFDHSGAAGRDVNKDKSFFCAIIPGTSMELSEKDLRTPQFIFLIPAGEGIIRIPILKEEG